MKQIKVATPKLIVGQPFAGTDFLGDTYPTPPSLKIKALQARFRPTNAAPKIDGRNRTQSGAKGKSKKKS